MSVTASAIAIIIALILFFILCYRGVGIIPCSILCAAVVALTTEGGLFGTMLGSFMTSTGNYVAQMLLPFTFGGMFAAMMTATGSSEKIGRYLISHFGIRFAPYAIMASVMLLALGGVSAFPFIIAPLAFSVLKAADLPRQIGAVIMVGCYSLVGYLVPGATNTANIIASQNYGTTLYAGAPIGITCFVIGLVLNIIYVEVMIRTYRKNGVGYTPSPTEVHTSERHDSDFPPFLLALAPILLVFILTMVLQLGFGWRSTQAAITSLLAGTIFLYLTNWNRIHESSKFAPSPRAWSAGIVPACQYRHHRGFCWRGHYYLRLHSRCGGSAQNRHQPLRHCSYLCGRYLCPLCGLHWRCLHLLRYSGPDHPGYGRRGCRRTSPPDLGCLHHLRLHATQWIPQCNHGCHGPDAQGCLQKHSRSPDRRNLRLYSDRLTDVYSLLLRFSGPTRQPPGL